MKYFLILLLVWEVILKILNLILKFKWVLWLLVEILYYLLIFHHLLRAILMLMV